MDATIIYNTALKSTVIESQPNIFIIIFLYACTVALSVLVGFLAKKMIRMHAPKKTARQHEPSAITRLRRMI